ncbi:UNVERIFIED_CONTAM: hypothetical protein Sangu_1293700 [Sesamum angustifolium]|uniref:Uncharacterized protein n=1 Tax=Sesamum angustifolium TaxID=2727405 RepID=A0AAW2NMG2_9LAMI
MSLAATLPQLPLPTTVTLELAGVISKGNTTSSGGYGILEGRSNDDEEWGEWRRKKGLMKKKKNSRGGVGVGMGRIKGNRGGEDRETTERGIVSIINDNVCHHI